MADGKYLMVMKMEDGYYIFLNNVGNGMGAMMIGGLDIIESMMDQYLVGNSEKDCKYMLEQLSKFSTYLIPVDFEQPEEVFQDLVKGKPKWFNKLDIMGIPCDDTKINFEGIEDQNNQLITKNKKAILEYKQTKAN